ncbi:MAG: hypothetical protein AB7U73_14055 [Pirellulales bacterium]
MMHFSCRSVALVAALALLAAVVTGCGSRSYEQPLAQADVVDAVRKSLASGAAEAEGSSGSAATATPTGTGWGSLTGTFLFEGPLPPVKLLPTGGKDAPTCNPDGIPDESLVVDPQTKGIKNLLVFVRKVSRINPAMTEAASQPAVFDQKNCMFLSHVLPVEVKQTVILRNSEETVGHNTQISPPADTAVNPLLPPGGSQDYAFGRPQNVPVPATCSIHPWMKAYIIPRDNPYFAVTDAAGKFTIPNIPDGEELEIQLWHESAAGARGALVVPGLTDGKGIIKRKLGENEAVDLGAIQLSAPAFQ